MKLLPTLTKRQHEIIDFIKTYIQKHGFAPSYREIAENIGVSSPATIHQHIHALAEKGYLKIQADERGRSIEPSGKIWHLQHAIELPLAGLIAAGEPIEAIENREMMAVPANLVPDENAFVLKVKGTSMIDDGILDGDYVIVERNFYPQNGDVVVALLDNQYATLKRYYRESRRIRLQPANSMMKPIYVMNPSIQGIVRAVIRKFERLGQTM